MQNITYGKTYTNKKIFKTKRTSMKKLALFIASCTIALCCCCSGDKRSTTKGVVNDSTGEPMFSKSMLSGTSWIDERSNEDKAYRISFTDNEYTTEITFPKSKQIIDNTYPYYLSAHKPTRFDFSKVGTESRGDFLVFYAKEIKDRPLRIAELLTITPQQLVILRHGRDTVTFVRE